MTYGDFVAELRLLRAQGPALLDSAQLHLDAAFRKWRHDLTDLIERIEKAGYQVNSAVRSRAFDAPQGVDEGTRGSFFKLELQDTLNELDTIIDRFEKFGPPPKAVTRPAQSIADSVRKHPLISMLLMCGAVAGATWGALDQLLVRPREFRIGDLEKRLETAEKQLAKLESDKAQLSSQLTDATKEALRSGQGGKPAPDTRPGETVVNFGWVDTPAPQFIVAAPPYLHAAGISVLDLKPAGSELVLVNNRGLYGGQAIIPTYSQNFLTQTGTKNVPASFTLKFARPLASFSFTRPSLFPATKSGVTHPAWSAHALDDRGTVLSSQSEGLTRFLPKEDQPGKVVEVRTYTLVAPGFAGIRAVRFESDPRLDGKPFAAFSAVLLERFTFTLYEK